MPSSSHWASLVAQTVKRLPAVQEGATHSSTLAWKIPWVEEPGGLQSMGSQRVGHDFTFTFTSYEYEKFKLFLFCERKIVVAVQLQPMDCSLSRHPCSSLFLEVCTNSCPLSR